LRAEYVDHLGDDLRVVNAARVSFDKESEWANPWYKDEWEKPYLKMSDAKLIRYLATHGHWTPFSHAMITVRETVPIFVARQRFKHMIGFTYNEVSRRYVDDEPEFYVPEVWRSRPEGSVKQGSKGAVEDQLPLQSLYSACMCSAFDAYEIMLERGVAPEQARMVLPQSMMTSYYVTGSLAAFARAFKQRSDQHAQVEIQELAKQWDTIIRPLFPYSWSALTE
jgi:thymidylate synthase (FAD)